MESRLNQLLALVAEIRAAVGDTAGKLTPDELVGRCRELRRIEEWADEGERVKAQRCEDGWVVSEEPEWNATLYIDP